MGACCGLNAMPVVEKKEKPEPARKRNVTFSTIPTLDFEVHHPGGEMESTYSLTRRSATFQMEQTMYTASEFNGSLGDTLRSFSLTPRDEAGRSLVTNGLDEVSERNVESFVDGVLQMGMSETSGAMDGCMLSPFAAGVRHPGSPKNSSLASTLTREQLLYLERAPDEVERIDRLMELEEASRQEIYAAWRVNSTLFHLAARRIMPTMRVCRPTRERKHRDYIVIHAKDITVRAHDDMVVDDDKSLSSCENRALSCAYSPCEEKNGGPMPEVTEHFQLLALTGSAIDLEGKVHSHVVADTWDFLSRPDAAEVLNSGDVFFRFVCGVISGLSDDSLKMIDTLINMSSFKNELVENNVPKVDVYGDEKQRKCVAILVKTMNILPGVSLANITPELLASLDYQRNCQPGENKFEPIDTPYTFRQTKTIVKFLYSVTIQMKVSEITDPEMLCRFKDVDGMIPAKVLMLERTRKNTACSDSTLKVRSFLIYYPVNEGLLVNNQTIVINKSIPSVVSALLQTFGSQGASDAMKTASKTRKYLVDRFGDTREVHEEG
uniref:Uncharacterized protein n=1 Tax=Trypanosoma congolense (strain IL3000) TaxID=1068625 RepID=G0US85_TRYCI|nr:conserved hypothetical protein [Trypanosoma congolense IL3000]